MHLWHGGLFLPLLVCNAFAAAHTSELKTSGISRNVILERSSLLLRHGSLPHRNESAHPPLSKRMHNFRISHVRIHTITVPVFRAAASLYSFYHYIWRQSSSDWAALPPLPSLRITNGFFSFVLAGTRGPIPWEMVAEVAANMARLTAMGFTGTYDIWYLDERYAREGDDAITAAVGGWLGLGGGVLVRFRIGFEVGGTGSVVVDAPFEVIP